MPQKRGVPGSKKGQAKPPKRPLDPHFKDRLLKALGGDTARVSAVAKTVGCTPATLYAYLRGGKTNVEALLLFALADALDVSARWLATGKSRLTPKESLLLRRYRAAEDDEKVIIDGLLDRFSGEKRN